MASLNINNHIKSSLEFVHRSTVVFLRYVGLFSNRRPFQSLHTRVCNRTSRCLQQTPHTEIRSLTKTTHRSQMANKDTLRTRRKKIGVVLPSFPEVLERKNVASFIPRIKPHGFCEWSFFRKRPVLLHTRVWTLWNGLWFENGPKYLRNTTLPRLTNSKEDLIWLLMLRKAILKNEVMDWFLWIFLIMLYNFFVIYAYFELLIKQKRSKDFLSTLYTKQTTCEIK